MWRVQALPSDADLVTMATYGKKSELEALFETHRAQMEQKINTAVNEYGSTMLIRAAVYGHTDTVKMLVEHKANIDSQDEDGWTALMYAARYGHTDIVKMLVEHKANVDSQNKDGWTALMRAAEYGHTAVVKILVAVGCNTQIKDNWGRTALDIAKQFGKMYLVTYLQEQKQVPPHRTDNRYERP